MHERGKGVEGAGPAGYVRVVGRVKAAPYDENLAVARVPEPDLAGYRIVWREAGMPTWQNSRDVGNTTRYTLKGISKDDFIFGVVAVDRDGNSSPASFPRPWRPAR